MSVVGPTLSHESDMEKAMRESQRLYEEEQQKRFEEAKKTKQKKKNSKKIPRELQRLFALLNKANKSSISTEELTKSFGWHSGQVGEQHDVQELNR